VAFSFDAPEHIMKLCRQRKSWCKGLPGRPGARGAGHLRMDV